MLPIRVAGWQATATGRDAVYARSDQIIAGLDRAVDPNGDGDAHDAVRIALLGVSEPFASFADSPEAQAVEGAMTLDTLVVMPAGNDGAAGPLFGSIAGPGGAAAALVVGATDSRPSTSTARVVFHQGVATLADATLPFLGTVTPARPLRLTVAVPGASGALHGKAALVAAGSNPAATVRAAEADGAAAVFLYGRSMPAGSLTTASRPGHRCRGEHRRTGRRRGAASLPDRGRCRPRGNEAERRRRAPDGLLLAGPDPRRAPRAGALRTGRRHRHLRPLDRRRGAGVHLGDRDERRSSRRCRFRGAPRRGAAGAVRGRPRKPADRLGLPHRCGAGCGRGGRRRSRRERRGRGRGLPDDAVVRSLERIGLAPVPNGHGPQRLEPAPHRRARVELAPRRGPAGLGRAAPGAERSRQSDGAGLQTACPRRRDRCRHRSSRRLPGAPDPVGDRLSPLPGPADRAGRRSRRSRSPRPSRSPRR